MPSIFISYRKEDTQGAAAHLFKNLSESFGPGAVHMDVTRNQHGRDVRQVIDEHLAASDVVLVIIGQDWVGARDQAGQRRLDSPSDLARIETAAALKRDLPVIPVLVQGAGMVQPDELPPELADLAFRNPVTLSQAKWGSDVETLVTLLQSLAHGQGLAAADLQGGAPVAAERGQSAVQPSSSARAGEARAQAAAPARWRLLLVAATVAIAVALGSYAFMAARQAPVDPGVAEALAAATSAVA
ncbi:MAG: toll/interleukin-1 receptor domain-containing protein, partial [Rhizobacter sp.]|nr:toll/interleukin-1 receptor domain-containing protein [Rhizobacter sp.]